MFRGSSGFPFCLVQNLRSPVLVHQSLDCFVVVVICGCESYFLWDGWLWFVMGLDLFVLIDNVFGVVHEFLPRTSYLCTVYSVSSILTAPCLFPRRKGLRGGQGTWVQLQVLPLCTNNVPGKTSTITQLSKNNINEFLNAVNTPPSRQPTPPSQILCLPLQSVCRLSLRLRHLWQQSDNRQGVAECHSYLSILCNYNVLTTIPE